MEAHVPVRTRISAELRPAEVTAFRRRSSRAAVAFEGAVAPLGEHGSLCRITDLSLHGARLQTFGEIRTGSVIVLTLPGDVVCTARVMWFSDFEAGCQFDQPLSDEVFARLTGD